jgi:hypothetical protein
MDDLELDLEDENITRDKKRLESLSNKVKETSTERDEAKAAAEAAEQAKLQAEKERDFFSGFSDTVTKYPQASEHKDAIKEKVLSGYSVEDATVAVLHAEGKFAPTVEQTPQAGAAAGGSAPTALPDTGTKSVAEMDQSERRALLVDFEKKGDISLH